MNTKLTLKLDKEVIKKAKVYAKETNRSLSSLVESFFRAITIEEKQREDDYSPIVRELSGIVYLEEEVDLTEEYTDYLIEKYK